MLGRYTAISTQLGEEQVPSTSVLTPEQEAIYRKKKKQTVVILLLAIPFLAFMMGAAEKAVEQVFFKRK